MVCSARFKQSWVKQRHTRLALYPRVKIRDFKLLERKRVINVVNLTKHLNPSFLGLSLELLVSSDSFFQPCIEGSCQGKLRLYVFVECWIRSRFLLLLFLLLLYACIFERLRDLFHHVSELSSYPALIQVVFARVVVLFLVLRLVDP